MTVAQKLFAWAIPMGTVLGYVAYRLLFDYRKIQKKIKPLPDPDTPLVEILAAMSDDYNLSALIEGNFEIKKTDIEELEIIGFGNFGEVFEGIYTDRDKNITIRVAVKKIRDAEKNYEKFIAEALTIKKFKTHHIVKLIGFVLKREPWIVMEFMENKDLKTFLKENQPDGEQVVTDGYAVMESENKLRPIFDMAIEIADGMAYLEDIRYVHRDLAARNCMVAADLTIK